MLSIILSSDDTSLLSIKDLLAFFAIIISVISMIISTRSSNFGTRSSIAMQCLNKYLDIVGHDRKKNMISDAGGKVDPFWREMLDLQFTEYHLWLNGHVDNTMMLAWCQSRRKDFQTNKPKYIETWETLKHAEYFPDGNFVQFMDDIHNETKILKNVFKEHFEHKRKWWIFGVHI